MNVILVGSLPPPTGGISRWTQRMLSEHLPDGWNIKLVNDSIIGARDVFGDNVRYNYLKEFKRWLGVSVHLFKACFLKQTPVVHLCPIASGKSMAAYCLLAGISRMCRKKVIIHFRCTVPNMVKTPTQKVLLKLLCSLSNQIIALNSQTLKYLERVTSTPIVVIPNFVDTEEVSFDKEISDTCGLVLYVGGVIKEKGCDHIVEIAKRTPDIQYRLVGQSTAEVREMAHGLKNVCFVGLKDKKGVMEEMQTADLFFFLSRFSGEGFSNAVVEAMAAGLPCVVTDWAANADQIEDGKGGIVVGSDVVEDAILALDRLKDQKLRQAFSTFNKEKVKKYYASNIVIEQYTNLYNLLAVRK